MFSLRCSLNLALDSPCIVASFLVHPYKIGSSSSSLWEMDSWHNVQSPAFLLLSTMLDTWLALWHPQTVYNVCVFVSVSPCMCICEVCTRQFCLLATSSSRPILLGTMRWITSLYWCVQLPFWSNGPLHCTQEHPGSLSMPTCLKFEVASLNHT